MTGGGGMSGEEDLRPLGQRLAEEAAARHGDPKFSQAMTSGGTPLPGLAFAPRHAVPAAPVPQPAAAVGCVCPPGANLQCERPDCPRKGFSGGKAFTPGLGGDLMMKGGGNGG
jgi:hypothetical protein